MENTEKCFKCGATGVVLYDAISKDGIVKICENCRFRENMPLIKRSGSGKNEKVLTVYERLSNMSGINPKEMQARKEEEEMQKKQSEEYKKIMEKNYQDDLSRSDIRPDTEGSSNLIRNFHWAIMTARRAKKISQKQLADIIGEPELAIRMAEKGILPRERERIVRKLETYLKIKITNTPSVAETIQVTETAPQETAKEEKPHWSLRGFFGLKKKEEKSENLEEKEEDKEQ